MLTRLITYGAALTMALFFAAPATSIPPAAKMKHHLAVKKAITLRSTARRWENLIGLARARTHTTPGTPSNVGFWRRRYRAVLRIAKNPPHKQGWLCIHRFEGSWRDGNDPYWGGLQMDRGFMKSYAPRALLRRGWANRWSPLEQMWVAERAHRSGRGYGPWPNTARYCGLLA